MVCRQKSKYIVFYIVIELKVMKTWLTLQTFETMKIKINYHTNMSRKWFNGKNSKSYSQPIAWNWGYYK